eukprot:jgi/Tetstr1/463265/TSEL_008190.t1
MASTRLPDDLYILPEEGGRDAPTVTAHTTSLTDLMQRMMMRLDELDSRTLPGQQPQHEQKLMPSTLHDSLAGGDGEDNPPAPGVHAKTPGLAVSIDPRD